jgi:hypothetical protein
LSFDDRKCTFLIWEKKKLMATLCGIIMTRQTLWRTYQMRRNLRLVVQLLNTLVVKMVRLVINTPGNCPMDTKLGWERHVSEFMVGLNHMLKDHIP